MNLTNYHSHCLYCDGRADMETFVRFAISNGFTSYGVSSHAPLPFPTPWTMVWDRMDDYLSEFHRIKEKYVDQIEFYVGLEIDYLDDNSNPSISRFRELPLDYRIGSVHMLRNEWGNIVDVDVSPEVFRKIVDEQFSRDLDRVIRLYYSQQFRMLELGGFDILGHADKMHYNSMCYRPGLLDEPWYENLMIDYFSKIARSGYMVEINSKAYHLYGTFFPNERYFPLLKELGIPVMVNSDAHMPEKINAGRPEALAALKRAGFDSVMELHEGKWQAVPIN